MDYSLGGTENSSLSPMCSPAHTQMHRAFLHWGLSEPLCFADQIQPKDRAVLLCC